MEVITMDHPEIKKRRLATKSGMYITVSKVRLDFATLVVNVFDLKVMDRIEVLTMEKEMWIRKTQDINGFLLTGGNKKGLRINDLPLCGYISDFFRRKPPFKLKVTIADGALYLKPE